MCGIISGISFDRTTIAATITMHDWPENRSKDLAKEWEAVFHWYPEFQV
jgi:hypothetical protein